MKISASLIVKNEESCLETCLKSIEGVDEIVIVDTGSEDNTIEIAKRFTDKVYSYSKCNDENGLLADFSMARNHSLSYCTGDWILIIDADEYLDPGTIDKIRSIIATTKKNAIYLTNVYIDDPSASHSSIRVFKNNMGIKWFGQAHNYLNITDGETPDLELHFGYSKAHEKDPDRTLRILTKFCKENPEVPRERYYLAREYWYRRDFKTAVEHYEIYIKVATWWQELADVYFMLAKCYWELQEGDKSRDFCLRAIGQNPDFKEALLFMAHICYEPWKSKWKRLASVATNEDVLFIRTK
jgi:glycosyltransferase involved in cell wall biosynthesis